MTLKLKENIEKLMKEQGLSQSQLAAKAKVSKATLHGYLNPTSKAQTKVDVASVKRICEVLNADLHETLFGSPDPNSKVNLPKEILTEIFKGDLRVTIHKVDRT